MTITFFFFLNDEGISKEDLKVGFVSLWWATMEKFVEGEVDKTCLIENCLSRKTHSLSFSDTQASNKNPHMIFGYTLITISISEYGHCLLTYITLSIDNHSHM